MKYYCECISVPLAEKLKEKGCEHPYAIPEAWEYGFIFDWLKEKGIILCMDIEIGEDKDWWSVFLFERNKKGIPNCEYLQGYHSWHSAANAAIEKALTLI